MVAGKEVDSETVRGKVNNFGSKNYRRVILRNTDIDNHGVWRLKLDGTFKIKDLELIVEES